MHTKLLDNFEYVGFCAELALCVPLKPILTLGLITTAAANRAIESISPTSTPEAITKGLSLENVPLQLSFFFPVRLK